MSAILFRPKCVQADMAVYVGHMMLHAGFIQYLKIGTCQLINWMLWIYISSCVNLITQHANHKCNTKAFADIFLRNISLTLNSFVNILFIDKAVNHLWNVAQKVLIKAFI